MFFVSDTVKALIADMLANPMNWEHSNCRFQNKKNTNIFVYTGGIWSDEISLPQSNTPLNFIEKRKLYYAIKSSSDLKLQRNIDAVNK